MPGGIFLTDYPVLGIRSVGRKLSSYISKEHEMTLEEIAKRLQALEDVEKIKFLHQHYMNLMDNLRYEEVLDLFTEDATLEVRNFGVKRGRAEMAEVYLDILAKSRGNVRHDGHMAIQPEIFVDGGYGQWDLADLYAVLQTGNRLGPGGRTSANTVKSTASGKSAN